MMFKSLPFFVVAILLSGCLVTRQQVREGGAPVKREAITPEQQQRVNSEIKYQEVEQQNRELLGRIETLENSVNVLNADKSGHRMEQQLDKKAMDEKLKIYEEAITKLETQYLALAQKTEALQLAVNSAAAAGSKNAAKPTGPEKSTFDGAEEDFSKKRWKEAIVSYEKYRSANPNGKRYAEATYKIGASFHELGMKTEAKAFYTEVVEKFPKSDWAKKSGQRLKTLK
jgi:TolA-binding protein